MPILQPDSDLIRLLRLTALLPGIGLCVFIFTLSSVSGSDLQVPFQLKDKILHVGAYGLLSMAWIWGFRIAFQWRWPIAILFGMAVGIIFGATDEYHQSFTPGRSPEFLDWVADAVGALGAGLFFFLIHKRSTP